MGHVPLACTIVWPGARVPDLQRSAGDRCNQSQARLALMAGLYLCVTFLTIRHHESSDTHLTSASKAITSQATQAWGRHFALLGYRAGAEV